MVVIEIMIGGIIGAVLVRLGTAMVVARIMISRIVGTTPGMIVMAGIVSAGIVTAGIVMAGIAVTRIVVALASAMAAALIRKRRLGHRQGRKAHRGGRQGQGRENTAAGAAKGRCIAFEKSHRCAPLV